MRNLNDFHEENDALEPQARAWADLLNQSSQALDHKVSQGLAQARQQAMQRYKERHSSQQQSNGVLALLTFGHPRMMSAGLLTLAIFLGLGLKQMSNYSEMGDAFLLSADLPPEAFADGEFEPWVAAQSNI